jgi:hypothetical protein
VPHRHADGKRFFGRIRYRVCIFVCDNVDLVASFRLTLIVTLLVLVGANIHLCNISTAHLNEAASKSALLFHSCRAPAGLFSPHVIPTAHARSSLSDATLLVIADSLVRVALPPCPHTAVVCPARPLSPRDSLRAVTGTLFPFAFTHPNPQTKPLQKPSLAR